MTLPEWAHTVSFYYMCIQLGLAGFCTWLYKILPPPSEIGSKGYLIFYGIVERIGLSGRKEWTIPQRVEARTVIQQIASDDISKDEKTLVDDKRGG